MDLPTCFDVYIVSLNIDTGRCVYQSIRSLAEYLRLRDMSDVLRGHNLVVTAIVLLATLSLMFHFPASSEGSIVTLSLENLT